MEKENLWKIVLDYEKIELDGDNVTWDVKIFFLVQVVSLLYIIIIREINLSRKIII